MKARNWNPAVRKGPPRVTVEVDTYNLLMRLSKETQRPAAAVVNMALHCMIAYLYHGSKNPEPSRKTRDNPQKSTAISPAIRAILANTKENHQ